MMVLFCGGYADGRWVDLPDGLKEYRMTTRGPFTWSETRKVEHDTQLYKIWDINLLGYGMKVAALANCHYESEDVIRALVQRDVFKHLTGKDRVTR